MDLQSTIGPEKAHLKPDLGAFIHHDLESSHTFNEFICCLHLPSFMSQAAIVCKISIVFNFSHVKAYVSKIDLAIT